MIPAAGPGEALLEHSQEHGHLAALVDLRISGPILLVAEQRLRSE
jgi:hypothetical protein